MQKLSSDAHLAIVNIVVPLIFLGLGGTGVYFFAKKVWNRTLEILQSPTPLWVSIVLVLLAVLYVYLKIKKTQSLDSPKLDFVITDKLKWKITIHPNKSFYVEQTPYCLEHDKRMTEDTGFYKCPHYNSECNNIIHKTKREDLAKTAQSEAEYLIRNKYL